MKQVLRRICGATAAVVGVTGVVLAAAAIVQTWTIAKRLNREVPATLGHLEAMTDSAVRQGEAALAMLDLARQRLRLIGDPIEELSRRNEQRLTADAILETLDDQIIERLESAEEFARAMQGSIRSMSSALLVLDSLPFFSSRVTTGASRESQWQAVAASLTEAADLLERVSQTIANIRSGQTISPQQLAQLRDALNAADQELADVQTEIRRFSGNVQATGARVTALRRKIPAWINNTAAALTAFFVCFGFSQISLLVHGWQLLRPRD